MKEEKAVSIWEVAKKAGVSKSTVSRVLNGYGASEKSQEKVWKAVEELRYRPNRSARSLRNNTKNLLGILIPTELPYDTIADPVNPSKLKGVVNKIKELNYDVLIFIEDTSDFQRLHEIIMEKGLSGLLLFSPISSEILKSLREYQIPYVAVNWEDSTYIQHSYVKTDLAKATQLGIEHLISQGYTDIGLINWESPIIETTFNEIMKKARLPWKGRVWNTSINMSDEAIWKYLDQRCHRAYFSFSYSASFQIMKYCKQKGLRMPQDVALISYEFFPFYDLHYPRLTGVRQQLELMGEMAAEQLVKMIEGNKEITGQLISPQLIIRETT
ncbi:MAG: LacI family transcriptional regulator [Epulopiscium sp.]|nr:LacI family transcriptional regulator [Candidatus Epulonipiscium sp.]